MTRLFPSPALVALLLALTFAAAAARAEEVRPLTFGVINQRSPVLTAEYWNPILDYVSARAGIVLELRIGRSAPETVEMAVRGELDFVYSNNLFAPGQQALGFRVIARPATDSIRGQIVALEDSPLRSLADLQGREVVFPSRVAFVGYQLTGDALVKAGVTVKALFAGNQEGAMAQLKAGGAEAAAVNASVLADFARREGLKTRTLWSSPLFPDIPVMAGPTVTEPVALAVREALVGMADTAEGRAILTRAAEAAGIKPVSFTRASDGDYEPYRAFYRDAALDRLPK